MAFSPADDTAVGQSYGQGNIQSFHLQVEAPFEESAISPPKEESTRSLTQTRGKYLQSRGPDFAPARKALWIWPWKQIRNRGNKQKAEESFPEEMQLYPYETLASATRNFHPRNRLDYHCVGEVYKGVLLNGQEVVVRWLSNSSSLGSMEFRDEVAVMSKLQHRYVVRFLGCCVERSLQMLVYEYTPNGGLDAYLSGSCHSHVHDS